MHILVVDDDPAVRASLRRALRLEGYSVGLASDGAEALAAVDADAPDVIVLDLMMPPPDGLEVCRRAGNRTPIDRFYRASAARPMPGSGLGLAIVREVVEAEGGTVRAGNLAGGGAVVEIHLQVDPLRCTGKIRPARPDRPILRLPSGSASPARPPGDGGACDGIGIPAAVRRRADLLSGHPSLRGGVEGGAGGGISAGRPGRLAVSRPAVLRLFPDAAGRRRSRSSAAKPAP